MNELDSRKCKDHACKLPSPHEGNCFLDPLVVIDYTNHQGSRRVRRIAPMKILFMASPPWHPAPEWLLGAIDADDGKHKFFPMRNIHSWKAEA